MTYQHFRTFGVDMKQTPQLLVDRDKKLVDQLVYQPDAQVKFNTLADYLMWPDELPTGITPDGLDVLSSLWVARSLLHKGLSLEDHPIDPEYSRRVWEQALEEMPDWPGFKRIKLDAKDQQYLTQMLNSNQLS